jgi:PmbA protein
MLSESQALDILDRALRSLDGEEADASIFSADRNVSRFANSSLRQNMSESSASLTVRVVTGGKVGSASTAALDEASVRQTADLARELSARSEAIPDFPGLYRGGERLPAVDSFDEETAALPLTEKGARLREVFRRGTAKGAHFAGTYTTSAGSLAVGNTHGVRRFAPVTSADALLISTHGRDSGFATATARSASQIDVVGLGEEALEKSLLLGGDELELEPGSYDVILEPAALSEIFEWLNMIAFSARAYDDGSSFLHDHIGKKVTGEGFSLFDDATEAGFLPFPFDLEGRPKRRFPLIENGIGRTPAVDSLFAARLGLDPNASCADLASDDHGMALHLSMPAGESSREEMISGSERAIWVTRFHYINGLLEPRSALMTGTTRDGTFLIEKGKVTRRLTNLRWTQSMTEAFENLVSATRERRAIATWWNPIGGTIAPTVKVKEWKFTGVQKAARL